MEMEERQIGEKQRYSHINPQGDANLADHRWRRYEVSHERKATASRTLLSNGVNMFYRLIR